jgi:signal peptide peptidase SppA
MNEQFWLGTESSHANYTAKLEQVQSKILTGMFLPSAYGQEDTEEDPVGSCTELVDNVAIISISGDLVNEDNWYNSLEGLVSYAEISRNLITAAQHPSCQSIILNIGSGGGTPNGLIDCMKLIEYINESIPVYAYSGSSMCSAAYFLPLPCTAIYAGEMATVGSIGVITIHTEITKLLEEQGIKKTTVRAGEYKAVGGNPYEKLSSEGKQVLQDQADYLMSIFSTKTATYRKRPLAYVQEFMANGKTFIGMQGLDVGIIDGVTTLDDLITSLQTKISKQQERNNMAGKPTKITPAMSAEQKAALVSLAVVPIVEEDVAGQETETEVEVSLAAEVATTNFIVGTLANTTNPDLVSYLQAQLKEAEGKITSLSTELNDTKHQLSGMDGVREIALRQVKNMSIALYGSAMPVDNLDNTGLYTTFKTIQPVFDAKFTAGQKTLSAEIDEPNKPKPTNRPTASQRRQVSI